MSCCNTGKLSGLTPKKRSETVQVQQYGPDPRKFLIAATALARKAVLVIGNKRHFEHIEGLHVETWSLS
jgi:predicted nucleic acid-binding protein